MGDDEYTRGRPHPMIDPSLRNVAIREAGDDPAVAILLFDLVLGFGSHPSPADDLADALRDAQRAAALHGRKLVAIGHVCGTDGDPQDRAAQIRTLASAGAIIADSNIEAAATAAQFALRSCQAKRGANAMKTLFKDTLKIVNVGLAGFGDNVVAAGGECVALAWQPPALGDRDAAWALAQVFNDAAHRARESGCVRALSRSQSRVDRCRDRARCRFPRWPPVIG